MLRKLYTFCKYDGLSNTWRYILNTLSGFFVSNSKTILLYSPKTTFLPEYDSKNIRFCTDMTEIERIASPRLRLTPYKKWLKAGSQLAICEENNRIVAYGWVHFHRYFVHGVGEIVLSDSQAWLGPFFVDKDYRGKGIQKKMIQYCMKNTPPRYYITSANAKNTPSLKSFEKLGFVQIGYSLRLGNLFSGKRSEMILTDEGKKLLDR